MSRVETASTSPLYIPNASDELLQSIQTALSCITSNERFLVVSHERPDGDAAGSTLAMGLWLKEMGKQVTCFNVDAVPYNFSFLPGQDLWTTTLADDADFDVTIMLDCGERHRVGQNFPEQGWGKTVLMVDHHKTWDASLPDIAVRDVSAAATGELIYQLIAHAQTTLSADVAKCLYCCVMTDTGGFRYSSTSPTIMKVASELLSRGVKPWEMTSQIYENQPMERMLLLSAVLQTLRRSVCGRLAFLTISSAMLKETGATDEMTDGIINYARSVSGVEVATQLRQIEQSNSWRISFRSRGQVDVSKLAERFGGGGHHNAAACTIEGEPEEIEARLAQALSALLDD